MSLQAIPISSMSSSRMFELATVALQFRNDCLRLAGRIDVGRDLRDRFREDAAYWAGIAEGLMFAMQAKASLAMQGGDTAADCL